MNAIWVKITEKFDTIIAIAVLIISLLLGFYQLLIIKEPLYAIAFLFIIGICLAYLLYGKRNASTELVEKNDNLRLYLLLNISFFAILILSVLSLYLRSDPYIRPISYFILTSIMVVVIILEVLCCYLKGPRAYFSLFKIMIIAFSLRWTPVLLYPEVIGVDPWAHQMWTYDLISSGHIVSDMAYTHMPVFHLLTATTSLVNEIDYRFAAMLSVGSLQIICDILFVFLISKKFTNYKIALLAGLLLGIANYHIQKSFWTIPNTLGATVVLMMVYVLLDMKNRYQLKAMVLWIFCAIVLLLTHSVATMYMFVLLIALGAGYIVYDRLKSNHLSQPISLNIFILFTVMIFSYWFYVTGLFDKFVILIKDTIVTPGEVYSPAISLEASFASQIFAYLGMVLFFSFVFWGLFFMISKASNRNSFAYAIGGSAVLAIAIFALFGGKTALLESRWIYFSQIMLALPLALTIWLFTKVTSNKFVRIALPTFLASTIAFFLIISPQSNIDNPTFNNVPRSAFLKSEIQAMNTVSEIWEGSIASDILSNGPFVFGLKYEPGAEFVILDYSATEHKFVDYEDKLLFIRRETIADYTTNEFYITFIYPQFSKIYSSGSTFAYLNTQSR